MPSVYAANDEGRIVLGGLLRMFITIAETIKSSEKSSSEVFQKLKTDQLESCKSAGIADSDCEKSINNAFWTICQSPNNWSPCPSFKYMTTTNDIIWSPYFWAGLGTILGILMVTFKFLVYYFVCGRKNKNQEQD